VDRPGPVFQDFIFFKLGDGPVPQSFSCYPLDVPADRLAAEIAKLTKKKRVILKWDFRSAAIAYDGFFEFERRTSFGLLRQRSAAS
jgi:hypothetical protein